MHMHIDNREHTVNASCYLYSWGGTLWMQLSHSTRYLRQCRLASSWGMKEIRFPPRYNISSLQMIQQQSMKYRTTDFKHTIGPKMSNILYYTYKVALLYLFIFSFKPIPSTYFQMRWFYSCVSFQMFHKLKGWIAETLINLSLAE